MNISADIRFTIPAVIVKATQPFMVAGASIRPGGLAAVSPLEARTFIALKKATPADVTDLAEDSDIPASGTVDTETFKKIAIDAPGAARLAISKGLDFLVAAAGEHNSKADR